MREVGGDNVRFAVVPVTLVMMNEGGESCAVREIL